MIHRTKFIALDRRTGIGLSASLAAVLLLFLISGVVSYVNTRTLKRDAKLITHTHEVLSALDEILSQMKDAETGQRGYLLTGDTRYLDPYTLAVSRIDGILGHLEWLTKDNANQQARIPFLRIPIQAKLRELEETIEARRTQGIESSLAIVLSDRGKNSMDSVRSQIQTMEDEEQGLRIQRIAEMDGAYFIAVVSGLLTGVVGMLLSTIVALLVRKAVLTRKHQQWLQSGQIGVSEVISSEQRLEQLGGSVLRFLAEYLDAHAGAFFVRESHQYRRVATYGVPTSDDTPHEFGIDHGLLGQAAKDNRTFLVRDVPEGYLTIGSALGRGRPRHLIIAPLTADGVVEGVVELGFISPLDESVTELFGKISESIGTAVRAVNYRTRLQDFLEETQRQAEELQTQGEELRVSNEELEEQSRALRESQGRLEVQQAELEQTNAQLEEQAQLLEVQRDDVTRAKSSLQAQAQELEQASRYKSDFLANMSHELRTPLNSSLILAKLLADNRDGNLSSEQVEYAETIQAAGNDLLMLINDILDLSKIEAGHMEMRSESIRVSHLMDDMNRIFQPVAEQKKVQFRLKVSSECPHTIETDRQRLEQVLKNLLSNALKFTEAGEVTLEMTRAGENQIAFSVKDTGIGIPVHQQQMIFEAFRQADGTTNRKYGGTGLGLSIARELTRLLGGEIHLVSEPDQGSTFTIILPVRYNPALIKEKATKTPREYGTNPLNVENPEDTQKKGGLSSSHSLLHNGREAPRLARRINDDRGQLSADQRVILVVEDDQAFTRIIYDLAHELGFQCLIATTAEEGIATAIQYQPSAVVLDVGLPDHSGLSVLDRLKHDARTRHIPVHVVSAHDYAQTALSLGAIGYMLKPIKREQLIEAFERLEIRLEQRLRRVLIVEDDLVQLQSLRNLLGVHDVETVGARSAAECLEQLQDKTFDCMVLDLSLPDASGYSLLETLSREDAYAFPPVIVYTGRELSIEEEDQLRRYSKSIIIKGAKSPERLLDEVALFLHQMVSELPPEQQRMLEKAKSRDAVLENRRILIVEDDVRNVFALTSILEPRGAIVQIARNGREALVALEECSVEDSKPIDLVLMDIMMPEMDGITATREIRKRDQWRKLPIIALTAKAMKDDQEKCFAAGANDYMAKPLEVDKLLSLIRVWMPR